MAKAGKRLTPAQVAKLGPEQLAKRIRAWEQTITRVVEVTEQVPTGEMDKYGHPIFEPQVVTNQLGEPVTVIEFVAPPLVGDFCVWLGVSRAQWDIWVGSGEYAEAAQAMEGLYRRYLDRELVTRKDVKGVIYGLGAFTGVKAPAEGGAGEFGGRSGKDTEAAPELTLDDKARLLRQAAKDFLADGDS